MGRSPCFDQFVEAVPVNEDHPHLVTCLTVSDVFRVGGITGVPRPRMERSCSTYGIPESEMPIPGVAYRVDAMETYSFDNRHGKFEYRVWYVNFQEEETKKFISWALREDGLLLNIESFSPRGWVSVVVVVH